ncbi:MAG: 2-phosphosulfolactate phosphatase, partial [Bacteroidales bacterium]|nr:2-phosphosulfolactate phosphatase [Bacteroidales bacterium]
MGEKREVETCFSPALYEAERFTESIVVVLDILRASSSICMAFENGAKSIIPVATVEEAKEYKRKGYLVAAERDGFVLDFADFGNSPFNFTKERVAGKTIVYSTTNGTGIVKKAKDAYAIVV